MRRVEQAGAGDVRTASSDALLDWFRKHQEIGQEIRKLCEPIRGNAPGHLNGYDGRPCVPIGSIGRGVLFKPKPGDDKVFVPGK